MFTEGARDFVSNQMHARIPNGLVHAWLNLCIDVNSFVRECFASQTKISLNIGKEDAQATFGARQNNTNGNAMKTIESI